MKHKAHKSPQTRKRAGHGIIADFIRERRRQLGLLLLEKAPLALESV